MGKDGRAAGTMPMPMAQFPFRGEMIRIMGYRRRGREHFLCLSLSLSLSLSPPPATTSSWSAPLPRHAASPPLWLLYPRGKMAAAAKRTKRGASLFLRLLLRLPQQEFFYSLRCRRSLTTFFESAAFRHRRRRVAKQRQHR